MQDVLVAARDLKVEEVLRPEMVKLVAMARATLPPGTFTSFKDVEDRWVQIKMLQGEPILDRKLAPKGSPAGLVPKIPKGKAPSPSRSTSRPASRGSSSPTTASTWSRSTPGQQSGHGRDDP